uniref:Ribulokinase n=1 Tax=Acrobeloides nanus TaxID=290746 RepID=A0A914BXV9_9BILA
MSKYTIGVDYGTLSCRAVLVDIKSGKEIATAIKEYPHSVLDEYLPDQKTRLEHDWALQYPTDYIESLQFVIPEVLKEAKVAAHDVIGIGLDFTSCTMLPIDEYGTPLCLTEKFKDNPHSYVKLWKHHAAQKEADRLNKISEEHSEAFLQRCGGKISSEWMIPKIWQILNEAPEIYDAAHHFVEAGDWVVFQLTGELTRNSCAAGYKAMWNKRNGYPSSKFLKSLDPRLENVISEKLSSKISPIGAKAGELTKKAALFTSLNPGTAVATAIIDAHAALFGLGVTEPGKLVMSMGTSTCHILLDKEEKIVPGVVCVEDGVVPGYVGYEAGQACVGDHFQWFVENCVPSEYFREAEAKRIDIYRLLTEKASRLNPGESGLLALDWWNGNRTTLVDADLTGVIIGTTLSTKPEEIYRALVEATAYGTRIIVEAFREHGVSIDEVYACGGLTKSDLVMQIYSDVLNMNIHISASSQATGVGVAMLGAIAAGEHNGGYNTIDEAAKKMGRVKEEFYRPKPENVTVYGELFNEYRRLYEYFGRENHVMKNLKRIKKRNNGEKRNGYIINGTV